jgi:BNR repeat-containing family member
MKQRGLMIAAMALFLSAPAAPSTWTANQRLTWTSGDSGYPAIAVDSSGILHVVWHDNSPGNFEIFYRRSTNGGATWSQNKRLTWTPANSTYPAIAADPFGRVHVVWHDYPQGDSEICYTRSTDGGITWAALKKLSLSSGDTDDPAVVSDVSGNVYVVWTDSRPGNWEIFYRKSADGGATWAAAKRITWTSGQSFNPAVAVAPSGSLHVVWWGDQTGNWEIYYKKSTNGGGTWLAAQRLSWSLGASYSPDIAVDSSGYLQVVWQDDTPGFPEIFQKKSQNAGSTWTTLKNLSRTSSYSMDPAIAAGASGRVHVVWYDTTPGNNEIYYVLSTNGGDTWGAAQRLTWTAADSEDPDVAVDSSGNIHVVWDDETSGNLEIYYKRGK